MITLCAIVKQDNKYLDEWVRYHLNLGITNIVLIDNNDNNEDYPMSNFINNMVMLNYVYVFNYRNKQLSKNEIYHNCYYKHCVYSDWIIFTDIDEYIVLKSHKTMSEFIADEKYKDANCIRMSMKVFNDNGLTRVENNNYNCFDRFTTESNGASTFISKYSKAIIKGGLPNIVWTRKYGPTTTKMCNSNGTYIDSHNYIPVYDNIQLNSYYTKTAEEYCNKIRRKKPEDNTVVKKLIDIFFIINERTTEKEQIFNEAFNLTSEVNIIIDE